MSTQNPEAVDVVTSKSLSDYHRSLEQDLPRYHVASNKRHSKPTPGDASKGYPYLKVDDRKNSGVL